MKFKNYRSIENKKIKDFLHFSKSNSLVYFPVISMLIQVSMCLCMFVYVSVCVIFTLVESGYTFLPVATVLLKKLMAFQSYLFILLYTYHVIFFFPFSICMMHCWRRTLRGHNHNHLLTQAIEGS